MSKIDILLATYNGEKYIEQQLLSLLAQTETNWTCYIHDDGSSDRTPEIIRKWCNIDNRFVFIEDGISLKNAGKNFLHLLKYSKSDYICFCDQDDVWLDSKLEKLLSRINLKDNNIPQVVFSNAYCWNFVDNSIYGKATLAFPKNIDDLLFLNCGIQGAAGIFNKKMKEVLTVPLEFCSMHDWYLTIVGCTFGQIDYLHENLMLYRQHENQVTGFTDSSMSDKIKGFLKRKSPLVRVACLESLKSFFSVWSDFLIENDKQKIQQFIQLENEKFMHRLLVILCGKWNIYNSKMKLILKFFIRPFIGE